jgi:hypothetical protein
MNYIIGITTEQGSRFYKLTPDEYETFFKNFLNEGGDYFYLATRKEV